MPQINPPQVGGGIVFSTPADLISSALEYIGVTGFGRKANAAEIGSGLKILNTMLDKWGVLRENISIRTEESFPLKLNQSIYAIGVNSTDFNTSRPIKIEISFYRDASGTDIPIDNTMSENEYSDIPIKNLGGNPTRLLYKPGSPFGTIFLDFAPTSALTLFIKSWKPLAKIKDPNDIAALAYPDGYEAAIFFNLAKMLCGPNKKPVPVDLSDEAISSLQAMQSAYGEVPQITNWGVPSVKSRIPSFFNMGGE